MAIVINKAVPDEPADRALSTHNRTTGAPPYNVLTPLYVGEIVLDTSTGKRWQAKTAANTGWNELTNTNTAV